MYLYREAKSKANRKLDACVRQRGFIWRVEEIAAEGHPVNAAALFQNIYIATRMMRLAKARLRAPFVWARCRAR